MSCRETWLHWYYRTLTNLRTFLECKTQTSTVNKKLHSDLDKLEVLVEDLQSLLLKLLKLIPTKDQEKLLKKKSLLSVISLPDHLNTTSQNGSLTDKRTQEPELGLTSFPISLIPSTEKIWKDWENARIIEVLDITGDSELEVREPSPLVDAERHSVLPERSEMCLLF